MQYKRIALHCGAVCHTKCVVTMCHTKCVVTVCHTKCVVKRKQEGEHLDSSWTLLLLPASDAVPTFPQIFPRAIFLLFSLQHLSYFSLILPLFLLLALLLSLSHSSFN